MRAKSMTEGNSVKHIILFALPILAGSLLQQLYHTTDSIIVGRYAGEDALSAVGTNNTFVFFFLAISLGLSTGASIVIAQAFGAKNEARMRESAATGMILLAILSVALTGLAFLVARPILQNALSVPDSILGAAEQYFLITAAGLTFQFAYNLFAGFLRAVGDSAATLYFLILSSVANILLDLLFVAGFGWSVAGAAVATILSQFLAAVASYFYMVKKYPVFAFKRSELTWDGESARKIISVGSPIALQLVVVSAGLSCIQRAVNEFGVAMTAAATVGQRVEMFLHMPGNAFQSAMATYTGQNLGAGKPERVQECAVKIAVIALGVTLGISILIWLTSDQLAQLFGISGEAALYCSAYANAIAVTNLILSLYLPIFGVFQGASHSGLPTVVATSVFIVRILVTYLFRYSSFMGASIVWWNSLFGFTLGCTVAWTFFFTGRWKRGIHKLANPN